MGAFPALWTGRPARAVLHRTCPLICSLGTRTLRPVGTYQVRKLCSAVSSLNDGIGPSSSRGAVRAVFLLRAYAVQSTFTVFICAEADCV